jgi:peptide/nickel transport system substrate-binding protein
MSPDPASLSLIGKTDINTEKIAYQVTDSLVRYDPQMNVVARVAESWTVAEEGRVLTFRLRPDVRWHDGAPVTAEDVRFTVEQVRDPGVESSTWLPLFRDLETVEVLDPLTVRAHYAVATPDSLDGWAVPLVPRHLAEAGAAILTGSFAQHPVGCGPFRFVRRIPGEEIVLEANEDYWDGRPGIDRLVFRIYPDQHTAFQALRSGDLDIMVAAPDLWEQARDDARLTAFWFYRANVWVLRWNMDGSNPFFEDPRVRQAMLLALDRQTFADTVLRGQARAAATSYHPELPWTDPELKPLPYDPGLAERRLDDAGWRRPAPGRPREREGRPFRFTLMIIASTQQLNDQLAAWLQQSWSAIGVEAELEKLEWNHYRERRSAGRFEAAMDGFSATPNPDQYELYHSSMHRHGMNYGGFADAEVDRLVDLGRRTFQPLERRRVYFELQRRLLELQPIGCLFNIASPVLHDRRLGGIEPSPLDIWKTSRGPRVWTWAEVDDGS